MLRPRPPTSGRVEAAARGVSAWRQVPGPATRRTGAANRRAACEQRIDWPSWSRCETGKIRSEARGEVQEMIDICDFAVGLSRQLYGLTIASERPQHR